MRNSKLLSLFLAILMVLSLFTLTACESGSPAKIGLSAIFDSTPNDATEEADGNVTHNGIFAAVLVDNEGKVLGISVVSHTETAGLGAVAAAQTSAGEAFRSQFVGMSGSVAVSKDGGSLDAITGATITSRAICVGVNAALACVANLG